MAITTVLLVLLVAVVGGVSLQIFLSRRNSKWPGLILPLLCVLFSLVAVLSMAAYTNQELTLQQIAPDGTVTQERVPAQQQQQQPAPSIGTVAVQVLTVLLVYNIPTAILLLIYFACRERLKKRKQLEKMNIQDLA